MRNHRILFGTNWKMHKTVSEALDYVHRLVGMLATVDGRQQSQVFVVPPFTAIEAVKRVSSGKIWVGAQNMHWAEQGAYTGEISPRMLQEIGVDLVELGHAERRQYFNETDAFINRKVHAALQHGFRALVCVGENSEDKQFEVEKETVGRQLKIALNGVDPESASSLIVAYEPVWAIGEKGSAADSAHTRVMSCHIRSLLEEMFGREAAAGVSVIYGGDVNARNGAELLVQGGVDGLFVGRAAWQVEGFADLIRACTVGGIPG